MIVSDDDSEPEECICCNQTKTRIEIKKEAERLRHRIVSDAKINELAGQLGSVELGPLVANLPGVTIRGDGSIEITDTDSQMVEFCPNIQECSKARRNLEQCLREVSEEEFEQEDYDGEKLYGSDSMVKVRARMRGTKDRVSAVTGESESFDMDQIRDALDRARRDLKNRAKRLKNRDRGRSARRLPLIDSEHPEIEVTDRFEELARSYEIALKQREELTQRERELETEGQGEEKKKEAETEVERETEASETTTQGRSQRKESETEAEKQSEANREDQHERQRDHRGR